MSRGYGVAQRAVLADLTDGPVQSVDVSRAHDLHIESVRRAMRTLARAGTIRTTCTHKGGHHDHLTAWTHEQYDAGLALAQSYRDRVAAHSRVPRWLIDKPMRPPVSVERSRIVEAEFRQRAWAKWSSSYNTYGGGS